MGTRGAWGFRIGGQDKITYNHFDSYLEGLGDSLVRELRTRQKSHPEWLHQLRAEVRQLELVGEEDPPTSAQKARLEPFADLRVNTGSLDDWYCLLRQTQGDLNTTLKAGIMIDRQDFLHDSMFCVFAYIINLDDETFEVYRGVQDSPHNHGRYSAAAADSEYDYYGVALVKTIPLNDLPEESLETIVPPEEET